MAQFSDLLGKTLRCVSVAGGYQDELHFVVDDHLTYVSYHDQDCCETVEIEEIVGDLEDLVGTPILLAEKTSKEDNSQYDCLEWTFYKLATVKGHVTIRWLGSSNGYYSTAVYFKEVTS